MEDWELYEELVRDIYQVLGKVDGIKIECWGRSCEVRGRSGVCHQIDVLISHNDGKFLTAIECKHWNRRKVAKDAVWTLSGIVDDTNIKKGILVSKSGFTSHAEKVAES